MPLKDLSHIYTLYVRSILEFNCCVWHFSITQAEVDNIERVQKIAWQLMLKNEFSTYENALEKFGLDNQRDVPLNPTVPYALRNHEKYKVNFASTSRLLNSSIPMMQRMVNKN